MDEVDDAVLFDLAKLSDQYLVERLRNHCLSQLFKGVTVQNAVMRLVQANTAGGEGPVSATKLKNKTIRYVRRHLEEIRATQRQRWIFLNASIPTYSSKSGLHIQLRYIE
jgi:hypothetical protein